jgi:hypothetical protein
MIRERVCCAFVCSHTHIGCIPIHFVDRLSASGHGCFTLFVSLSTHSALLYWIYSTLLNSFSHTHCFDSLLNIRRYPMQLATRQSASLSNEREWRVAHAPEPAPVAMTQHPPERGGRALPFKDQNTVAIASSLVGVRTTVPYGHLPVGSAFIGTGLIVDAEKGLVVMDRLTVPTALGDCELNFGDFVKVPAEVVFIHPVFNIAVCRYDPAAIGDTPVRSATLVTERPSTGDKVVLTGVTNAGRAGTAVKSYPTRIGCVLCI